MKYHCRIKMSKQSEAGVKRGRRSRRRARQQELPFDRGRHGGKRAGAGRKPGPGRRRVPHGRRPRLQKQSPVHVTTRMVAGLRRLRAVKLVAVLRRAFAHGCKKTGFRICQFSIQGNHIHMICEASDATRLARGVQGWAVRIARGVNRVLGRRGKVFGDRYHARYIKTPREMRAALCYVLNNARRHGERLSPRWNGIDPFSSAWWFDGWNDDAWRNGLSPPPLRTVETARSWLLTTGWRRRGLIGIEEVPPAGR